MTAHKDTVDITVTTGTKFCPPLDHGAPVTNAAPAHSRESHGPCVCTGGVRCGFCRWYMECPICAEQEGRRALRETPEELLDAGRIHDADAARAAEFCGSADTDDMVATARRRQEARAALGFPAVDVPYLTACEEALTLVYGDRQASYGHPFDDYTRTSAMVEAFLGLPAGFIGPRRMAGVMALVKLSRESHRPKRDNRVDLAGYAECMERIAQREDGQ